MKRYNLWILLILIAFSHQVLAQPGLPEMKKVTQDLNKSFFSAMDASLVLSAIFGLCGAMRIYHNWQLGKHHFHVDYEIVAWFSAALFMVLMGAFLRALFGL